MDHERWDVAVVGGGIVGLATAKRLAEDHGRRVVVVDAEEGIAAHQTGNNSGVVHSGLYYRPGSLKARNCVEGRIELEAYCRERGIAYERCGKVVVATSDDQIPALDELEARGRANGLDGMRRIGPDEIRKLEPYASGVAGLHVPETGIVEFVDLSRSFAADVREAGGEILAEYRVTGFTIGNTGVQLRTTGGAINADVVVGCAGLQSDRLARMGGLRPEIRIVPFRGEYYVLREDRRGLVNNLIYPVPDPRFPFLGVHFTRRVGGEVEAGPNAVLAFKREGYTRTSFSLRDTLSTLTYPGFWKLATKFWRTGLAEQWRSLSRRAFVRSLQQLVPEVGLDDVRPGGAGVRAQALKPTGELVDDFVIQRGPRQVHVLNAPSPAATAALAIGRRVAATAVELLD